MSNKLSLDEKGEVKLMRTIPFKVLETVQSYNVYGESISTIDKDRVIEIRICKQFGTLGYAMNVDKIVEESQGDYSIYLSIIPPEPEAILLQVVTYKTIIIEIDKKDLGDSRPYSFRIKDDMSLGIINRGNKINK